MAIQFLAEAREIIKSQFIGKDFDTWVADILSGLEEEFGTEALTNLESSGFGIMWIEILANALASMSWQLDREADETTLETAIIRENVVNISRHLGYKPYGAVPPFTTLTLTLDAPSPATAIIPSGSTLTSDTGLIYSTIEEVTFLLGETGPKTVVAREGEAFEEVFTADNEKNQKYRLESVPDGKSIAEATVTARIGGVLWDQQKFLTFDQTNIYEVELGREPPLVRFGDGIAGNIPPDGAEVRIGYFATSGTAGVVLANTITAFDNQVFAGITPLNITITHPASSAGSNRQPLSEIKIFAPLVFQTGERGVTKLDIDSLINTFVDPTFGAVAIGRATVPRSAASDAVIQTFIGNVRSAGCVTEDVIAPFEAYMDGVLNSNCKVNIVNAQILAQDSLGRYVTATPELAEALEDFLNSNDKVIATVIVQSTDGSVNLYQLNTELTITFEDDVDLEARRQEILLQADDALRSLLIGRTYGIPLRVSDIYALVEAIVGVKAANFKITGYLNRSDFPAKIDEFGNLILGEFEVFTMGNLPVVSSA